MFAAPRRVALGKMFAVLSGVALYKNI